MTPSVWREPDDIVDGRVVRTQSCRRNRVKRNLVKFHKD